MNALKNKPKKKGNEITTHERLPDVRTNNATMKSEQFEMQKRQNFWWIISEQKVEKKKKKKRTDACLKI